ncbi:MAG TPA: 3-hydroxyacyl-CoA dehydrogenase NAD-binding domain-containing protein [Thermoanaerobaculia bacterium]|nr:3-hydroxyacyl-CoA dehydrogenase NAD-binding domain-containing protein [Thermoanaerobaculia bacterium]
MGRLVRRSDLAWLWLDEPGRRVNTLSARLLSAFEGWLAELEQHPPAGLVVISAKPDTFVAGADLEELAGLADQAGVLALVRQGHGLLLRLEKLPCPTVAAIHGACLGGGLELALACRFRVATRAAATRLGLPEVELGLIPGLGGTQRLPRRIGVMAALDLLLTGRRLDAESALRRGLVDEVCDPPDLEEVAERLARRPPRRPLRLGARAANLVARLPGLRRAIFGPAEKQVLARTQGCYPAPLRALEVVARGLRQPLPRALETEATAFAELVTSETARNLVGLFFLKKHVEAEAAALAKGAPAVERLGVVGAGFMGAGVAQLAALRGLPVVLIDRDEPALARGTKQVGELFGALEARRRLVGAAATAARGRVVPTLEMADLAGVDLVIEAVFEDLAVKHQVLGAVEAATSERLVFASNTSALPIASIAAASRRPERVVGMHFFSPVAKMPLLEVIHHPGTDRQALAMAVAVGERLGKTVVVVADGPGFLTTRVLAPLLNEAARCLLEGASIPEVDRAATAWGWPVGPLALLDEVGLDVARHAQGVMTAGLGVRFEAPPPLARLADEGRFGRKAGRGFYRYEGKAKTPDVSVYALIGWQARPLPAEDIADRLWLAMLNETARAIEDGILRDPRAIDLAVVFGFGFPPFRGGLLREADRRGLSWVVDRLSALAERYGGEALAPAPLLVRMAAAGEGFHAGR